MNRKPPEAIESVPNAENLRIIMKDGKVYKNTINKKIVHAIMLSLNS